MKNRLFTILFIPSILPFFGQMTGGSVFKMDISGTALPYVAGITGTSFYDMTVNDGKLYGVDAKDFKTNGSLEMYDLGDNSLLTSKEVGIIPGEVYFNGMAER